MRVLVNAILLAGTVSCASDVCVPPPCALTLAATVTVTSTKGDSVPGSSVSTSGAVLNTTSCSLSPGTTCDIFGGRGTYQLTIAAPGFQSVQRSITVDGTTENCGCGTVNTQHLDVVLSPVS